MSDNGNEHSPVPEQVDLGSDVLGRFIRLCLENKLVVLLVTVFFIGWGVFVAPFPWELGGIERNPVPVDAIPDLGENQQIVFTGWPGRSPQDIEDQITYPLTSALLGVPGVRTIRSISMFGFSSIYIIFDEDIEFYWSRSRVLEKLSSLPIGLLPEGVQPTLGPDATGLGQIYWYTLEGRDPDGNPIGGWDLNELRSIQDWDVRFKLMAAEGVSEVASIGGFAQEYQIDVDPVAMREYRVTLDQVVNAVRNSNIDVGARTMEINNVEYVIRGRGFIRSLADVEGTVIREEENVPIYVRDVAHVSLGPAERRGALEKHGAEAVGGVVVVRYGYNPLEAIENVNAMIDEIAPGLPWRAVVNYQMVTPDEVRAFAENSIARPVFDTRRVTASQLRYFAEQRDFEPFIDDEPDEPADHDHAHHSHGHDHGGGAGQPVVEGETMVDGRYVDESAWVGWMRRTPRDEWPRWLSSVGFEAYVGGDLNQPGWRDLLRTTPRDDWPEWIDSSRVSVVPFYDRTGLIYETLGTLSTALQEEILVVIIVVLVLVFHFASSVLISSAVPLAILMCFIGMSLFGVDANVVALSGIAIAIGAIVDMAIIVSENVLQHLDAADPEENRLDVVHRAAREVSGAVLAAVATTVIGFLPVLTMTGSEGKMFKPLAFTYISVLAASVIVALAIIPPAAHVLFTFKISSKMVRRLFYGGVTAAGVVLASLLGWWLAGGVLAVIGAWHLVAEFLPGWITRWAEPTAIAAAVLIVVVLLTRHRYLLGPELGFVRNFLFIGVLFGGLLLFFHLFRRVYGPVLRWFLAYKLVLFCIPAAVIVLGGLAWLGFDTLFSPVPAVAGAVGRDSEAIREGTVWTGLSETFPGLGREFMPSLDEGSFLLMPTTMPHASIGEALDVLKIQGRALAAIPEVELAVGKIGRAESALDPAPVSMIETVINYKPEYKTDAAGHVLRFKYDREADAFVRDDQGELIEDRRGQPYRNWREHIRSPDDIWEEIREAVRVPGTTDAPKLHPIETRLVMLQTGMRAPIGAKIKGPDPETVERVGLRVEELLKQVPGVRAETVTADRVVGKPYIEIDVHRDEIARHNISVRQIQDVIEIAIGGRAVTTTVEGRERYPVRVRYQRELRDQIEELAQILVSAPGGAQVPLGQLTELRYVRGPQMLKGEDTHLVSYVTFDRRPGYAEVDVVESAQAFLAEKEAAGEFDRLGTDIEFAGNYEHQLRARQRLQVVLPLSLFIIFVILYLKFKSVPLTTLVFSGIIVAWAGGFILIWCYNQPWFLNFEVFGANMRHLFQMPDGSGDLINLSVAIWVGFLVLFGIASDDAVVMVTYLNQVFRDRDPDTVPEIREAAMDGALRRVRPCLMTSATTILALIPVLTATGRGSDVMIPMALPIVGGIFVVLISLFVAPVFYAMIREFRHYTGISDTSLGLLLLGTGMLAVLPIMAYCRIRETLETESTPPADEPETADDEEPGDVEKEGDEGDETVEEGDEEDDLE